MYIAYSNITFRLLTEFKIELQSVSELFFLIQANTVASSTYAAVIDFLRFGLAYVYSQGLVAPQKRNCKTLSEAIDLLAAPYPKQRPPLEQNSSPQRLLEASLAKKTATLATSSGSKSVLETHSPLWAL